MHAYKTVCTKLNACGYKLCQHKLGNEASNEIKEFITMKQATYQYVPPEMHCTKKAEKAVKTWENHIKAGLACQPKDFTIAHWSQSMARIFNPICSRSNQCSFPLQDDTNGIPGNTCLVCIKLTQRALQEINVAEVFHFGPAINHY